MKRRNFLFTALTLALILVSALGLGVFNAAAAPICSPATPISLPFSIDGAGDFCFEVTNWCGYVNSWNLTTLEINGTAYTNMWVASSSIPPVNGKHIIHYVSTVAWGHMEVSGTCGPNPTPTRTVGASATRTQAIGPTPTRTNTQQVIGPTATRTRTPTSGPSATRTRTSTSGPSATRTSTPTVGVPVTPTRTATPTQIIEPPPSNPFVGAVWYRNPDYTALVNAQAASTGGTLGAQMAKVANYGTGIWLDSIDSIHGVDGYPRSLAGHLDAALAQNANLVTIVLYNLPNRNCGRITTPGIVLHGELQVANGGLAIYKSQYIDPIVNVLANPAYASLRIVVIVEPDSLHNLVWNSQYPACNEALTSGAYVQGIQYAINRLATLQNTYLYADIGHSGAPGGWPQNVSAETQLYASTILGTTLGANSINGFITNTANYSVTTEPYLTANQLVGGMPVYSALFFDWNPTIDEANYATTWKNAMINNFNFPPSSVNMLIDTSRNGWGGSSYGKVRPTGPSLAPDLNTFVNESRTDRRFDKFVWCNQAAGIGAVPQANPPGGVFQAYVWVMPPGISDGSSVEVPPGPQNPQSQPFDRMCDPTYVGFGAQPRPSGAMTNAPVFGAWFADGFATLVANAFPPLP